MASPLHDNPRSKEVAGDDEPPKKAFVKKPNKKIGDYEYEHIDPDSRGMGEGKEEFAGEISRPTPGKDTSKSGLRWYHPQKNDDGTKDLWAPVKEEKPNS